MPKRNRSRRMRRGGWLDSLLGTSSPTASTTSTDSGIGSWFSSTKKPTPPPYVPPSPSPSPSSSQYNPSSPQSPYNPSQSQPNLGGKRRKSRKMRGGYSANSSSTSLSNSMPFSGSTAKPHAMVGGRTKKYHKKKRSRRHR